MKKMKDSRTSSIVLHNLLIAVLAFIWLIPIIWLVCTSFSAYSGMNTSTFFPKEWSISNYMKLFHSDSVSQFPQWFLNTFIIACFTCVISTMFVLMVAYATSVMRFKMRKPLMNMAVILNLFPGMLAMIAVYFTLKSFNLTNSYAGLIMVYSASSGLGYLIAKGFFDTVPRALCEAARIDGAGPITVLLKVYLPISLPALATVGLFAIVNHWNDYFSGLIYMSKAEMYPLQTYIQQLTVDLTQITDANQLKQLASMNNRTFNAAKIVVSTIPLLVIYPFLQKYFVTGMVIGAVKE